MSLLDRLEGLVIVPFVHALAVQRLRESAFLEGRVELATDGGVLPGIPLALLLQLGDEVPAGPLQGRVAEGIIVVAHAVSLRGSGGVAARVRACVDQVLGHPGLSDGCIQGKTDDGLVTARGDRVQEGVNLREVVGVVSGGEVFTGKGAHSSV